jgi:hypothetical protein
MTDLDLTFPDATGLAVWEQVAPRPHATTVAIADLLGMKVVEVEGQRLTQTGDTDDPWPQQIHTRIVQPTPRLRGAGTRKRIGPPARTAATTIPRLPAPHLTLPNRR